MQESELISGSHLSLFSGIGGLDLAAHWVGFETVAFVEREPYCQQVLARHWPEVPIFDDVTTFDGRRFRGVTIVSAGFPCQPHSVAGKRLASGDERDLWGEVVRVLRETDARWFVGENVPGLLSSESGRFFGRVVNDLAALGYRVGWGVWGASDVGACHRRKRVFIVGYAAEHGFDEQAVEGLPIRNKGKARAADSRRVSSDTASVRLEGLPESGLDGQDDQEREGWRESEPARSRLPLTAHRYRQLPSRDWRTWDVKPVFRSGDDGVPGYVVRHRVNILRALGNAVCPQQAFPIFEAIARMETA